MYRTGVANLPLHGGNAPAWLTVRMRKLAKEVASIMIEEQGTATFIQRLSDPYWFQAFGCVLGYDWHSSGVTTVVTGILKSALSPEEHGVAVCGGKGKTSKKTPCDIASVSGKFGFSEETCYHRYNTLFHNWQNTFANVLLTVFQYWICILKGCISNYWPVTIDWIEVTGFGSVSF